MPIPHLRAALDGLASYRPTDGVARRLHRLRPLSANESAQVATTVAERHRVRKTLLAESWDVPDCQGNLLWLRLGEDSGAFGRWCLDASIAVRVLDGEGVRVSIGATLDNDAFLTAAKQWRGQSAGVTADGLMDRCAA